MALISSLPDSFFDYDHDGMLNEEESRIRDCYALNEAEAWRRAGNNPALGRPNQTKLLRLAEALISPSPFIREDDSKYF